ncbi:hypothetical protein GCM10027340_04350 [Marinomonas epiphytica]
MAAMAQFIAPYNIKYTKSELLRLKWILTKAKFGNTTKSQMPTTSNIMPKLEAHFTFTSNQAVKYRYTKVENANRSFSPVEAVAASTPSRARETGAAVYQMAPTNSCSTKINNTAL